MRTDELLRLERLKVWYPVHGGILNRRVGDVKAVDDVSLTIHSGEVVGLVGESGSGKSTLARAVVGIERPTAGRLMLRDTDLASARGRALRDARKATQMVFQDPYASLDPRQRVNGLLKEALRQRRLAADKGPPPTVPNLLELVGLPGSAAEKYGHEFSGGQRQRISIARALAVGPELLLLDEAVSSLDVSVQAQIVNMLKDLQAEAGLAYLFITHDLAVVKHIAHRIFVMYLGKVVESAPTAELFSRPSHPYTAALLSAVPIPDVGVEAKRERIVLSGDAPSPRNPPRGCRFHPRCWLYKRLGSPEVCVSEDPALAPAQGSLASHGAACHFANETVNALAEVNTER